MIKFKSEAAMTQWLRKTRLKFATSLPLNGDAKLKKLVTAGMVVVTVIGSGLLFVFHPRRTADEMEKHE